MQKKDSNAQKQKLALRNKNKYDKTLREKNENSFSQIFG